MKSLLQKSLLLSFKFVSWLIHICPYFIKNLFGDAIGILWFDILRIRRKLVLDNLLIAFPNMSLKERVSIGRTSLRIMGRSFVDYFSVPFINQENYYDYFVVEGEEHLINALKKNKGVLLTSLHLGSYDFAACSLACRYKPFYIISKTFKIDFLNKIWFGLRESKGIEFIGERRSSFDILKALKKNGIVCFIIDQFMGPPIGVKTHFFNKETGSPMGLAIFSMKTNAPLVPVYTYKKHNKNHLVFCPEIPFESQADKDQAIITMTQKYNYWLEAVIKKHPEQWMWVHNRWKRFKY